MVLSGSFTVVPRGGGPARTGRSRGARWSAARGDETHERRIGRKRLPVIGQDEIVELCAEQTHRVLDSPARDTQRSRAGFVSRTILARTVGPSRPTQVCTILYVS